VSGSIQHQRTMNPPDQLPHLLAETLIQYIA
jgi:hypothetical protein